jgi:hypothetical protein
MGQDVVAVVIYGSLTVLTTVLMTAVTIGLLAALHGIVGMDAERPRGPGFAAAWGVSYARRNQSAGRARRFTGATANKHRGPGSQGQRWHEPTGRSVGILSPTWLLEEG